MTLLSGTIFLYINGPKKAETDSRGMKFLAIESLRISLKLNISAAREQQAVGLGLFNVVASWVIACEYLSLGLHVGNHSRPTPLTIIFYFC